MHSDVQVGAQAVRRGIWPRNGGVITWWPPCDPQVTLGFPVLWPSQGYHPEALEVMSPAFPSCGSSHLTPAHVWSFHPTSACNGLFTGPNPPPLGFQGLADLAENGEKAGAPTIQLPFMSTSSSISASSSHLVCSWELQISSPLL